MKNLLRLLAVLPLFVGLSVPALAQQGFDLEKTKEVLTAEIEKELAKGVASISISLVHGEEIVWSAAFGYANVWAQTPATPETIYCTGSTFKAVTATAIMQLVEQGKITLDDPVNDYLGENRVADMAEHPVTFRHILSHASGLTPGEQFLPLWSRQLPRTLEELTASLKAVSPPEEQYVYNNHAFGLAGYLIERITGEDYEDYIVENILVPLGVETSNPVNPSPQMVERMALPYIPSSNGPVPVPQVRFDVFPAGDIHLTAEDMARFLAAHLNGGVFRGERILSEESVAETHRPQFFDYGLGWSVSAGAPHRISHGGGLTGFLTSMVGDLDAKVGVYVMSNSGDMSGIAATAMALLRGEDPAAREERQPINLPREVLQTYVGKYEVSPESLLTVTRIGMRMFVEGSQSPRTEIRAFAEGEFFIPGSTIEISFVKEESGEVNGLVLHQLGDHPARRIE